MTLYAPIDHPLPELERLDCIAELPLAEADEGPIFDRREPHDVNDAVFADWETPLVWHHHLSQVKVSTFFQGRKAVHFAFEGRTPEDVWQKGWNIWYDHALLLREKPPADVVLTGTFAMEELTTGLGADNVTRQRPWTGLVARMQDLRRYYYLCLEFPGRVVLYRRDDDQWTEVAGAAVQVDIWTPYRLTLAVRGNTFEAWLDEHFLFLATDYRYRAGWAGLRSTCTSFVTDFRILEPEVQISVPPVRPQELRMPEPELAHEIDLSELGPLSKTPRHNAFIVTGRFVSSSQNTELVVQLFNDAGRPTHAAIDLEGNVLWQAELPGVAKMHVLPADAHGLSDLVGVANEYMVRIDGKTGEVLKRAETPESPLTGKRPRAGNGPKTMADLDGDGRAETFFLTCGCNDPELWAIDEDLNVCWFAETLGGQGHGQHLSVCDVDGDARDEISAGLCLLDADGKILWSQDHVQRLLKCPNGHHVDSSVFGFLDGPEEMPTIHYQASSAGHIVLGARSGHILAVHPQGHVQHATAGSVVPGHPGVVAISSNRWGSYGVTGLYSGKGDLLGRLQPGFVCQAAHPLNWTGGGLEHLLVVDGRGYRGIYDHRGERRVDLEPWVPYATDAFAQRYDRVNVLRGPLTGGVCDDILIRCGSRLAILTADREAEQGGELFSPVRKGNVSWPG